MKILIVLALTAAIYYPALPWVAGAVVAYYALDWLSIALKTRGLL